MGKTKLFFSVLAVTLSSFISLNSLFGTTWYYISVFLSLSVIFCVFQSGIKFFGIYKWVNLAVLAYGVSICYSTYKVQSWTPPVILIGDMQSPYVAPMYFLQLLSLVLLIEYCNVSKQIQSFIGLLFKFLTILIVLSDIFLFTNIFQQDTYLLGNKFTCTYLHVVWLFIYIYKTKNNSQYSKLGIFFGWVYCFIMTVLYDCSTTLASLIIVAIIYYTKNKFYKLLYKPYFIVSIIILLDLLFFFYYDDVLKSSFARFIIVDLLHRDLTLSTRTYIWEQAFIPLSLRPIWGIGCFNTSPIVPSLIGYPNLQNGLLNCVLEIGIVGSVVYLIVLLTFAKANKNIHINNQGNVFVLMCYAFIFASTVEVTLDNTFLCFASLMLCGVIKSKIILRKSI